MKKRFTIRHLLVLTVVAALLCRPMKLLLATEWVSQFWLGVTRFPLTVSWFFTGYGESFFPGPNYPTQEVSIAEFAGYMTGFVLVTCLFITLINVVCIFLTPEQKKDEENKSGT